MDEELAKLEGIGNLLGDIRGLVYLVAGFAFACILGKWCGFTLGPRMIKGGDA